MRLWEEVIIPNEAEYNKLKIEPICNSSTQPSTLFLFFVIFIFFFK